MNAGRYEEDLMGKIVVLGSLNMDLVMGTNRLPQIGETILGESIDYMIGGKGANQAVAAARMGNEVTLLGCIGTDTFGDKLLKHLKRESLDLSHINRIESIFTGIANIFKLPKDNAIVVIPGANSFVDEDYLMEHVQVIEDADVILSQLEIPTETVAKGLRMAKEQGKITILNPAPFNRNVLDLLPYVDVITPNETEFEGLIGRRVESDSDLEEAMLAWAKENRTTLIVTRGGKGSSYIENDQLISLPAAKAEIIDTTGAGDTFNGILASELSSGVKMIDAVAMATTGASLSVAKFGAQTGMPTRLEVISKLT